MESLTFSIDKNVVSIIVDGKKTDEVTFPPESTEKEIKSYLKDYIRSIGSKPVMKGKKHRNRNN
jgi:hypothetical protein